MPSREVSLFDLVRHYRNNSIVKDQVLKSGSLYKKAQRTKRWIKRWFILKNDALSWYQSSSVSVFEVCNIWPLITLGSLFPTWCGGLEICHSM